MTPPSSADVAASLCRHDAGKAMGEWGPTNRGFRHVVARDLGCTVTLRPVFTSDVPYLNVMLSPKSGSSAWLRQYRFDIHLLVPENEDVVSVLLS